MIFINTAPPNERVQLLKPINDILEMEDDCEGVYTGGLLQRYAKRPFTLEHLTLADWAAWYGSSGKPYIKKSFQNDTDNLPFETASENNDDYLCNELSNEKKNKKRSIARVIRSVWFNKEKDPEKHYRELIMLFTPWRNEETDLLANSSSYKARFLLMKDAISEQMKEYAVCGSGMDKLQEHLNGGEDTGDHNQYDSIAPFTQDIEYQDKAVGDKDLHPDFNENYDLSDDVGIPSTVSSSEPLILNEMQDQEYRQLIQTLNKKQKEFFYHILHLIKTSDKPFYYFLSGGAGVGKSHLIRALYQAAVKHNSRAGKKFNEVKILLLAPTGKAAYGIKGNTVHSALAIPACQSLKTYKPLDSSRLNTLRCKLRAVQLIFLDEISIIGNTMLNVQINNRLKHIKGSREVFGGISIIALGDLFQLEPVMDSYVFKDMKNSDYGSLAPNLWQGHLQCLNWTKL